jgi:hypothetical protein
MKAFGTTAALLGLTLAASLGAAAAQAGSFSETVSGNFVDTSIDTNADGVAAATFLGKAKGNGGPTYQGLHEIRFTPTGLCASGEVEGVVAAYSIVRRYNNGDLLFSRLVDGSFCFNPGTGTATVAINAEIIGGTGHFEGATGSYAIEYEVTALLPDPTGGIAHGAFVGTVTGTLNN